MKTLGLIVRRERWGLSWRGKILALILILCLAFLIRIEAYPFLAVNHPQDGDLMILEAWIPNYLLSAAAAEFKRGHYRKVLVVRGIYSDDEDSLVKDASGHVYSDYASRMLVNYGVPREAVEPVFYAAVERDRTYHTALAAKDWLERTHVSVSRFNVVTQGPHARRSWLMFRRAFGNTAEAGVVPLRDPMYDPNDWWGTSEGVREMLGEMIAYMYARFIFSWT